MRKEKNLITIGRVGKAYGLRGFVKLQSFTTPAEVLLERQPLFVLLRGEKIPLEDCQRKGNFLIGKLKGCNTPEAAKKFANFHLMIPPEQLPKLHNNEYYWADLIGLDVYNLEHQFLGCIDSLFETGANDVMVIKNEKNPEDILIPYVLDHIVKHIDLEKNTMIVEWQLEW